MLESLSFNSPPLQRLQDSFLDRHGVCVDVLRLDRIDPQIQGNKWFKLKWNLVAARDAGMRRILSFGGAWSNHLHALAAASNRFGFDSIGVVRGELPEPLNPVLAFARAQGMTLYPVSRGDYRTKSGCAQTEWLQDRFGPFYLVPEGGSNEAGVRGCEEIAALLEPHVESPPEPAQVYVACGTGATLAGLIRGMAGRGLGVRLTGVAVLKGADYLQQEVSGWLHGRAAVPDWRILLDYHFGGYARRHPDLDAFVAGFMASTGLMIEPVYTGRLFAAIYDQVVRGEIGRGERIIALHTGGICNK